MLKFTIMFVISKLSSATMVFRKTNGEVTGYGGYYAYEQLVWLSLRLNFRYVGVYVPFGNESQEQY